MTPRPFDSERVRILARTGPAAHRKLLLAVADELDAKDLQIKHLKFALMQVTRSYEEEQGIR